MSTWSRGVEDVIKLRGISASIFENLTKIDGREVTFHKVSVQRAYKDGDDWKNTTSFGRDDLPVMNLVTQRAYEWILEAEAKRKDDAAE